MLHCVNKGDHFPSKNLSTLLTLCTSSPEVSVSVHLLGIHLVTVTIIAIICHLLLSSPHLVV